MKVTLRYPDSLHERLTVVASEQRRSLNSEIVKRLESSFEGGPDFERVSAEVDAIVGSVLAKAMPPGRARTAMCEHRVAPTAHCARCDA